MKTPKLELIPNKPVDKKAAKIMNKVINYEYKKNKEFVDAVIRARMYIETIYGIKTPDQPWELIMTVFMKQALKDMKGKPVESSK
jgi:hypothetical protein